MTISGEVWRDPAIQRLPLREQRPYLEGTVLARCATNLRCEARDGCREVVRTIRETLTSVIVNPPEEAPDGT